MGLEARVRLVAARWAPSGLASGLASGSGSRKVTARVRVRLGAGARVRVRVRVGARRAFPRYAAQVQVGDEPR